MRSIPIVDYLEVGGEPRLLGTACVECGAIYVERRTACGRCGSSTFERRPLQPVGRLRTFTIIHRAGPGVETPFVSAIVALDGGGVVKANVRGVEPDPSKLKVGMPLRLTTYVAGTDAEGTQAIAFCFEPETEGAA